MTGTLSRPGNLQNVKKKVHEGGGVGEGEGCADV